MKSAEPNVISTMRPQQEFFVHALSIALHRKRPVGDRETVSDYQANETKECKNCSGQGEFPARSLHYASLYLKSIR
jgi:hypothetical protein